MSLPRIVLCLVVVSVISPDDRALLVFTLLLADLDLIGCASLSFNCLDVPNFHACTILFDLIAVKNRDFNDSR